MMRVSPTILAAGAALLVPHAAQAATIEPLAPCYRSVDERTRETVQVRASGFTPGERVDVSVDGVLVQQDVTVLTDGQVVGGVQAPFIDKGEREFTLTVTEADQPSNTVTTTSRVTALSLRLKPRRAAPRSRVRFIGSGFTDGAYVYAHYLRKGKLRKTVRLGAPQGLCGSIDVRRRQIPLRRPALGRWWLQVDNQKAYSAQPDGVRVRLPITVTEKPRRAFAR
jgi:hypothetical protein